MFDPKDSKTIGYHVFFLPSGELFNSLQNVINMLAQKYHGAKFEPHVTLLARIPKDNETELVKKSKNLANIMKPFKIKLKDIFAEDAYFRALYIKAEYNLALEEYHQKSLELFGVKDVNTYIPHLSLYYGNTSQFTKNEMIKSLLLPSDMNFLVDRIYLYRTEGGAENWVQIGSYLF